MNRRVVVVAAAVLTFLIARGARASVKFKDGVILKLQSPMTRVLPLIELAHEDVGITRGTVITSGTDGQHSVNSLHYLGLAVDIRTRDLSATQKVQLSRALRVRLNGDVMKNRPYQIVIESDHFHIEYQPAAGVTAVE